jgi:hypothetical protein
VGLILTHTKFYSIQFRIRHCLFDNRIKQSARTHTRIEVNSLFVLAVRYVVLLYLLWYHCDAWLSLELIFGKNVKTR